LRIPDALRPPLPRSSTFICLFFPPQLVGEMDGHLPNSVAAKASAPIPGIAKTTAIMRRHSTRSAALASRFVISVTLCLRLVNHGAVKDCHIDAGFFYCGGRNVKNVLRQDHQIRKLAGFE
jgi:hypothetical protein